MRLFGCPLTILNTLNPLDKFDGKSDEGYLLGYSTTSKAFRLYNKRTKRVEENMHIDFLEDQSNVTGSGPDWMFDLNFLTNTMNNIPVSVENQVNVDVGTQEHYVVGSLEKDKEPTQEYILLPLQPHRLRISVEDKKNLLKLLLRTPMYSIQKMLLKRKNNIYDATRQAFEEEKKRATVLTNLILVGHLLVLPIHHCGAHDDEDVGAEADFNNMDNTIDVSPIPTPRVHKDHPKEEPKTISQALKDESWVEAMQEELLQFKLQKVWILVDLPSRKKAIGTKWEEGIDYDEVFAPVARIEAIRLFLAFASFMGFPVYQMDVKSAFLYGTIEEEVYVHQPPGFVDPAHPNKVYKVIKALYGLHQAPRAWYETLSSFLLENGFRRGTIDKTLFIKKNKSDIIQDKYVADILKKFDFCSVKTATTPLVKDEDGVDVDVHVYRSMIGSLMYLTASKLDIMFAVCACARDSPFELEAFLDSDYGGPRLDRKSTIGGCQFLGRRLISWQCKKQRIVANSTTEAEYVTVVNCCG
ncbi:putative ribonuclease H-like domain-containing protein [Tanacetum coccineum]